MNQQGVASMIGVRVMSHEQEVPMWQKLVLSAVSAVAFTHAASACVTVKVYNDSDKDIEVVWQALGCAGAFDSFITVCKHTLMKAHSGSVSHDFPWGQSVQTVLFHYPVIVDGKREWVRSSFGYIHKHNRYEKIKTISTSPGGCHRHYTVHYTNDDVAEDTKNAYQSQAISTEMDSDA
jgi:hypothetical protein